jgi:hypothetical protein
MRPMLRPIFLFGKLRPPKMNDLLFLLHPINLQRGKKTIQNVINLKFQEKNEKVGFSL